MTTSIKICNQCGKEVIKRNKDIRKNKTGLYFCSNKCRVICFNKMARNRMKPQGNCAKCFTFINKRKKYCDICRKQEQTFRKNSLSHQTIGQIRSKRKLQETNRYTQIRDSAKALIKKLNIKKCCCVCGYDVFVDLCHIKPIGSFCDDVLIEQVNKLSNLTYLCPNHHKEFDNDLLSHQEIKTLEHFIVNKCSCL